MNHLFKVFLFVAMSQFAQAEALATPHNCSECKCMSETDSKMPMEQSLKNLESKLNLTEPQKPLWTAWSNQLLLAHHTKDDFNRTETDRRKLPAPARQELWMTSVETHLQAMKESLPKLKAFYGSLNDQQKVAFDSEVPFKHHGSGVLGKRQSNDR